MRTAFSIAVLFVLAACNRVYDLPDPPPESERASVALDPAEEHRQDGERYVAARRSLLELYEALDGERWDDATELLSTETQLLLSSGGSGDAAAALAAGQVTVSGESYAFDPVNLFLLANPDASEDSWEGEEENETGIKLPYVVTVVEASGAVVGVRRN